MSLRSIAKECSVHLSTVQKVRDQIETEGDVQDPALKVRDCARGPGSKCLTFAIAPKHCHFFLLHEDNGFQWEEIRQL